MSVALESHRIHIDAWQALHHGVVGAEYRRGGLVEVAWSGIPIIFFNVAVVARVPRSIDEFAASIRETVQWIRERQRGAAIPWMLAVCPSTLGSIHGDALLHLERSGFALLMTLTGMVADEFSGEPDVGEVAGGTWMTESDSAVGRSVLALNEAAYHMPMGTPGATPFELPGWWVAGSRMASVLHVGGRPASCAAALGVAGMRYLACVATYPDAQRRGFGTAAVRHVLRRALAMGMGERVYLHATPAGRPVYERLGFVPTAEYVVFSAGPAMADA